MRKLLLGEENNQQNEKEPAEWEKIFANHISAEGLTSVTGKGHRPDSSTAKAKQYDSEMGRETRQTVF